MGRLIDADEYEKRIKPYDTEDVMDKALYNFAHGKLITTSTAQQWIPVEERLPEDGVYVLICDGEHFKDYDCKNGAYSQIAVGWTEHGEFRCWDDRTHMSKVIAWMPLPEPYKDGSILKAEASTKEDRNEQA